MTKSRPAGGWRWNMGVMGVEPFVDRRVEERVREGLASFRVVYLNGPRQCGKTTLARKIAADDEAEFETLDDPVALAHALDDPVSFVERSRPLVIDEVQRGGQALLLAIKARVDREPDRGRFLLTGSTRFLTTPKISESLAGRVDLVDMWPLSQGEIERRRDGVIDWLFGVVDEPDVLPLVPEARDAVFARVVRGGFPEAVVAPPRARARWFRAYVETVTRRDIPDLVNVRRARALPQLARLLAAYTATRARVTELASASQIPRTTLDAYLDLLEVVFLVFRLPAWSSNLTARSVRTPVLHFVDAGVAAHLTGADASMLADPQARMAGPLLESFVVSEIARQATWSVTSVQLFHYRDRYKHEVDLVLERNDGRIVAIEVKAGRSVGKNDLRSLRMLRDKLGPRFHRGVVFGTFERARPLGDRLTALPLPAIWQLCHPATE